jgi:hypothetical protein
MSVQREDEELTLGLGGLLVPVDHLDVVGCIVSYKSTVPAAQKKNRMRLTRDTVLGMAGSWRIS